MLLEKKSWRQQASRKPISMRGCCWNMSAIRAVTICWCTADREDCRRQSSRRNEQLLAKRAEHIPLQQLTGEQEFMGLTFSVNEHVLIPRQDTEVLVEEVMKNLHDGFRILDLCTGSGCILLSLLHYSNDCSGVGADLSEEALEVAAKKCRAAGGKQCVVCAGRSVCAGRGKV